MIRILRVNRSIKTGFLFHAMIIIRMYLKLNDEFEEKCKVTFAAFGSSNDHNTEV